MMHPVLTRIRWRELFLSAAAALLLLSTSIYTGYEWLTVKRLSEELAHEREYLAQKDLVVREQADLERRLVQQREKTRRTLGALPTQEEQPALLAELNRHAAENKVSVAKLIVHPPNPANGVGQEVEFEAVVHGTYANLKNYLAALLSGERYLALKSLELVRPEGRTGGVLEARLVFAAYFLPEPDLVEPPASPEPFQALGKADPFS